ncbi:hypothetical protein GCM10010207_64120 [Streptomyces atratus]|nr:hypothetical protein GCM10010207_64120 [Streptomyces atratus]
MTVRRRDRRRRRCGVEVADALVPGGLDGGRSLFVGDGAEHVAERSGTEAERTSSGIALGLGNETVAAAATVWGRATRQRPSAAYSLSAIQPSESAARKRSPIAADSSSVTDSTPFSAIKA